MRRRGSGSTFLARNALRRTGGRNTEIPTHPSGVRLLFQYRDYGIYWAARTLKAFGDQIGWIALIWLALKVGGGAPAVGVITFLYLVPQAAFAPLAGVRMDRVPKARAMAVANAAVGVLFVAIPLAAAHGGPNRLILVYVRIVLAGSLLPFDSTGSSPLIGELVPEAAWPQAYTFSQTQRNLATLVGPAVGGLLIPLIGTPTLLYADGATFFLLAVLLWSIRPTTPRPDPRPASTIRGELAEGFDRLRRYRSLLALSVIAFLFHLLYGPYDVVLPVLAELRYGGSRAFGLLWTAFAAGSRGGTVLFSSFAWKPRLSTTLAAIIALWGVVTLLLAMVHSLPAALALMALGGLEYTPWNGLVITARQKLVPRRMQGITQLLTRRGSPWEHGPPVSPCMRLGPSGQCWVRPSRR